MRPRIGFKKLAAAGAAVAVGVASTIAFTSGPATASVSTGYSGFASGSHVYTGIAHHGPATTAVLGCARRAGLHDENETATVKLGDREPVARTVKTTVDSHNDARGNGTTSEAVAAHIKLGSRIELVGARTTSRAVYRGSGFETTGGTTFLSVRIGGISIPALLSPAPNTKVAVPGLGFVVLNWTVSEKSTEQAYAAAAAVLIHSTVHNPYLPKGATVAVLLTKAMVGAPATAVLRGKAYTTHAKVGDLVKSSPTSVQYTCLGTNGKPVTVAVAAITIPGLVNVYGASTTKYGSIRRDGAMVWFSSQAAGLTLGSGPKRLEVGVLRSRATAVKTSAGKYIVSASSEVLSIEFGGKRIPVPTGVSRKVTIAGIELIFNKVVRSGNFISVTALEIRLSRDTVVEVAHSEAGIIG